MKRVVTPELLDEDLGSPEEIRDSLLDLRGLNQHFGGFSSIADMLSTVARLRETRSMSFLDVAGGTGDVAMEVANTLAREGIDIHATVLDRAISHISRNPDTNTNMKVAGDALGLPFQDNSYDVVGCNLFCHHLEPDDMVRFFNDSLRVSRYAVVVSDLRRTLFHLLAAYAGRLIYRSRITGHDAPVSVRRAYTISEISSIARKSKAARHEVKRYRFQRFGLILWKANS